MFDKCTIQSVDAKKCASGLSIQSSTRLVSKQNDWNSINRCALVKRTGISDHNVVITLSIDNINRKHMSKQSFS